MQNQHDQLPDHSIRPDSNASEATFGSGCFWCTEAFFRELDGVLEVSPGYSGGHVKNPAYREVCNGTTGHAEVVRVRFDPERVGYRDLLDVFWATHDPTTLNRQGNDVGTQYRSAIFFHDAEQQRLAEISKTAAEESGDFPGPIVTQIAPLANYFPAEDDHKDYFARNPGAPYCSVVIAPKMGKFRRRFAELLATGADSTGG